MKCSISITLVYILQVQGWKLYGYNYVLYFKEERYSKGVCSVSITQRYVYKKNVA